MAAQFCKGCGKQFGLFFKPYKSENLCYKCFTEEEKNPTPCCKECGKKLGIFNKTDKSEDLCYNCFTEEEKNHAPCCKECGKKLTITLPIGDLCSDCKDKLELLDKLEFLSGKPRNYKAKYLGGYAAYPKPKDVKMLIYFDRLEVPELGLTIPYDLLENIQSASEETLVITFNDVIGIEQNPVFDVLFDKISEIQPFLYQQMVNARMVLREL